MAKPSMMKVVDAPWPDDGPWLAFLQAVVERWSENPGELCKPRHLTTAATSIISTAQ